MVLFQFHPQFHPAATCVPHHAAASHSEAYPPGKSTCLSCLGHLWILAHCYVTKKTPKTSCITIQCNMAMKISGMGTCCFPEVFSMADSWLPNEAVFTTTTAKGGRFFRQCGAIQGSQRSKISKRCPSSKSEQFAKSKPQTAKVWALDPPLWLHFFWGV